MCSVAVCVVSLSSGSGCFALCPLCSYYEAHCQLVLRFSVDVHSQFLFVYI